MLLLHPQSQRPSTFSTMLARSAWPSISQSTRPSRFWCEHYCWNSNSFLGVTGFSGYSQRVRIEDGSTKSGILAIISALRLDTRTHFECIRPDWENTSLHPYCIQPIAQYIELVTCVGRSQLSIDIFIYLFQAYPSAHVSKSYCYIDFLECEYKKK